ncbi:hypothetical protein GCM10009412_30110 [Aeromonas salmonicida subsp. achromogenes]
MHLRAHARFQHGFEAFPGWFELTVAGVYLLQTLGVGAEGIGVFHQTNQPGVLGSRVQQRAKILHQFGR